MNSLDLNIVVGAFLFIGVVSLLMRWLHGDNETDDPEDEGWP